MKQYQREVKAETGLRAALAALALVVSSGRDAGALRIGPAEVEPVLAAGQSYDDNVTFVRDSRIKDWITVLSAGLTADIAGELRRFELLGKVNQQLFLDHSRLNNTSADARLLFESELTSRDQVRLENGFSHSYEPRSFDETLGRSAGRFSYYRNRFRFAYTREVGGRTRLAANYGNEIDRASGGGIQNSTLNGGGLKASYSATPNLSFFLAYDGSARDFDPGRSATLHRGTGGLRKHLSQQLFLDASAGAQSARSYDGHARTATPYYVSLTDDLDARTRTSVSYAREISLNPYLMDVFDSWQASAFLARRLSERLDFSLNGFYGEGDFASAGITDELVGASVGFDYDLSERVKGTLSYTYSRLESNRTDREYAKNRAYFGLAAGF